MIKINKKSVSLTVAGIIVILLAWSVFNATQTATGEIKIGGAFGLSGQCAEFGEGELKSAQLAIAEANKKGGINGKKITLVVENTECEYKSTFNAINKLINVDKVSVVLGPTWGDSFQSAVPLVNKLQVPTISSSAAMEAILLQKQPIDYYFSTWFSGNSEMQVIQDHMLKLAQKNVIVVHDQDPFGVLMSVIFKDVAKQKGINLVEDYDSVTSTEDYRVILAKIQSQKPDAIFMSFIGPDSKVKFMKQAREFGITTPMYSASDIQNETLLASHGRYMEGVTYSFPKTSGNYESFVTAYTTAYGSAPQAPSAANSYDAARIAIAALKKSNAKNTAIDSNGDSKLATGPEIQRALKEVRLEGVSTEILGFNENHQMEKSLSLVKEVRGGKFVEVK